MAYIRYKEITRNFTFSKYIEPEQVPSYVKDYVYDEEKMLAVYRVGKDYSVFTDKKMVIFDNSQNFGGKKEVMTIPYRSATAHSIAFHPTYAEIYMLMETSNPLILKFSNLKDLDKYRLRVLYNAISAAICEIDIPKKIIKCLTDNDFRFGDEKEEK